MYRHTSEDEILSENSTIFVDSQAAPADRWRNHSSRTPANHQNLPQDFLPSPLNNLALSSDPDSTYGLPSQHERSEPGGRTLGARQATRPAPRPSQNRAPFGKWKSKLIPGFPTADTPLPHGITAKEICESYPNHVNDHVILALMREGKGAKAIDALIPPPPDKQKAGQSHSKIQLRVSTIREAFPDESFPISSTKRSRARSKVHENGATSSEDECAVPSTADVFSASKNDIGRASSTRERRLERTQHQKSGDILRARQTHGPVRTNGHDWPRDSGSFTSPRWSPLQQTAPSLLLGASDAPACSTSELAPNPSHLNQSPYLTDEIKRECERHHQLVFDVYYSREPWSRLDMDKTVQAHCAANYDAVSQKMQARCGMVLDRMSLADGTLEHPISYLQRSVIDCFQRLSESRAAVGLDTPKDQPGKRVETAVIQYLLDSFRFWTRELETKLETARQIRAHKNAHVKTTTKPNVVPDHHARGDISSQANMGDTGSYPQSDLFLPRPLTPRSRSATFGALQPAGVPDDGAGCAAAALFTISAGSEMKIDRSVPGAEGSGKAQLSKTWTDHNLLQDKGPELLNPASAKFPELPNALQHPDQRLERPKRGPKTRRSTPAFAIEDHVMVDRAPAGNETIRDEFEAYMEDAGQFVDREARHTDLPPMPDIDTPDKPAPLLKTSAGIFDNAETLSAMENDIFILYGWETLSRHVFGVDAEAEVEQQRDELSEMGEDEMRKCLWRDLQAGDEDGV